MFMRQSNQTPIGPVTEINPCTRPTPHRQQPTLAGKQPTPTPVIGHPEPAPTTPLTNNPVIGLVSTTPLINNPGLVSTTPLTNSAVIGLVLAG
jgi:hypothetical protein